MIELERSKEKRWILQKNINSRKLLEEFIKSLDKNRDVNRTKILDNLKNNEGYKGRSSAGSENTIGVRYSQTCFYMFGYKTKNNFFVPTKTSLNIKNGNNVAKNALVNLFSIQYPHPYSKTSSEFRIYAGRLIIKLLCDDRIDRKIYIDEAIWFILFLKTISEEKYNDLICSILEFRVMNFDDKMKLFSKVYNYENLFANCLHEFKYYFVKIFEGFGVFSVRADEKHNDGKILNFKHSGKTYRNDSAGKNNKNPCYIELTEDLLPIAKKLLKNFTPFENPTSLMGANVFSHEDWIYDLYESELESYLSIVLPDGMNNISKLVNNVRYNSKFSSTDGKGFEIALLDMFNQFQDIVSAEILSGPGKTDILCVFEQSNADNMVFKKINIEAKSRKSFNNINVSRLLTHLDKTSAEYCLVIAQRFVPATLTDISDKPIVLLSADTLASYFSFESLGKDDFLVNYSVINDFAIKNQGKDITPLLNKFIEEKHGYII
jgi:hypothetical protein